MQKNPYAVIALGGYGREEQCIHSDVDLLFLFERAVPEEAVFLVEEMVYPLWDMSIQTRITSYNVCYTKLLRIALIEPPKII